MLQPIKYRITCRRTVSDPKERARRLALLYSIFAKPKQVKAESDRGGVGDEKAR